MDVINLKIKFVAINFHQLISTQAHFPDIGNTC